MTLERRVGRLAMVVAGIAVAAGCGGGAATSSPSASPTPSVAPVEASASPSAQASPSPSVAVGTTLDAPASVKAGLPFEVAWTGTPGQGDYVTMVVMGVTQWTNEQRLYTTIPSPGRLVAPTKAGEYELWYVRGASDLATARRPITVTP